MDMEMGSVVVVFVVVQSRRWPSLYVSIEQNTRTNTNFSCQFAFYANVIECRQTAAVKKKEKKLGALIAVF